MERLVRLDPIQTSQLSYRHSSTENLSTALNVIISRTNVTTVGSVFNDMPKVKVLTTRNDKGKIDVSSNGPSSLLTPDEGPLLETSIFPLSFQVVREPLPFAYSFK